MEHQDTTITRERIKHNSSATTGDVYADQLQEAPMELSSQMPMDAMNNRPLSHSVTLLNRASLPASQRHRIVLRLGQEHGNQYVQRVLSQLREEQRGAVVLHHREVSQGTAPPTHSSVVQRTPHGQDGQQFSGNIALTFQGRLGVFSIADFEPSPRAELQEFVRANLTRFSETTNTGNIIRSIIEEMSAIHRDVPIVPLKRYRYRINVSASTDYFDVDVVLQNRTKLKKAGTTAVAVAEAKAKSDADAKAKQKIDEQAHREAQIAKQIADMKYIHGTDGAEFVERPRWQAEEKRLRQVAKQLALDIPESHRRYHESRDEAGLIARTGSAFWKKGPSGFLKPDLEMYWKFAQEYYADAMAALEKGDLLEAHSNLSMVVWSIKKAEDEWKNWLRHSAEGAGTAIKWLTGAKYAGMLAGTALAGEVIAVKGLIAGSAAAAGFAMSYDAAEQISSVGVGIQKKFDAYKTGKIGAATFFLNWVGGTIGGEIGASEWVSAIAEKISSKSPILATELPGIFTELMKFIPNSAFQEVGTQILGGVDPDVFKRPEDVTEKIMTDPTFGNAIMLWGEKYLRLKKK